MAGSIADIKEVGKKGKEKKEERKLRTSKLSYRARRTEGKIKGETKERTHTYTKGHI